MPTLEGDKRSLEGSTVAYGDREYNPTDRHRDEAQEHREHARQHFEAATALESFTDAECRGLTAEARVACPLTAGVAGVDVLPDGVRVRLALGIQPELFLARARCHHAFGREHHFQGMSACPFYLRGVELELASDGTSILIRSSDPATVDAIHVRVLPRR